MTGRIFFKLILTILCILVVALAAVDLLASRVAERSYVDSLTRELASKGRLIAGLLIRQPEAAPQGWFAEIAAALSARLTLIAPDGTVLVDSEADPARMENHAQRPEVVAAQSSGQGSAVRPSNTLGIPYLYVAVPVDSGAKGRVLRLAVPLDQVKSGVNAIRKQMLVAMALAFLPAFVLAAFFARHVSRRLAAIIQHAGQLADGNFKARLSRIGGDELGILERKLNETGEKLQHTVEQLQKEHAELEKLERVRKDFVINVSHELRTPLASIQGYTETLLDGAVHDPENNIKFLAIIRQNAERLTRLTADLLTLSRIELKTQRFQFASYYINTLIRDSVAALQTIAEKKQITLCVEPAPEGTEVFCDSEAVHQILSNLLDNAIKYTPEGGQITVGVRFPAHAESVEIYVRDTGIGIPQEDLPRLFERFYRVDKARSRALGGTGLGLAIVKHLVKAQGGEVRVRSTPGEGSEFSFTLPVQDLGLTEYSTIQGAVTSS